MSKRRANPVTKPKAPKAAAPLTPPAPAAPLPTTREGMLELLSHRQAAALLAAMEAGQPSAATMGVARQSLADNDTTHRDLKQWKRSGLLGDVEANDLPFPGDE